MAQPKELSSRVLFCSRFSIKLRARFSSPTVFSIITLYTVIILLRRFAMRTQLLAQTCLRDWLSLQLSFGAQTKKEASGRIKLLQPFSPPPRVSGSCWQTFCVMGNAAAKTHFMLQWALAKRTFYSCLPTFRGLAVRMELYPHLAGREVNHVFRRVFSCYQRNALIL